MTDLTAIKVHMESSGMNVFIDMSPQVQQVWDQGFCVLHDFVPRAEALRTRYDFYRIGATCGVIAQNYATNLPYIPFYTRVSVIKDNQTFAKHISDEILLLVGTLLMPKQEFVTATTMVIDEPGTVRDAWHAGEPFDQPSTHLQGPGRVPHVTTLWMYSPFRADNGGLLVRPGSHRLAAPAADDRSVYGDEQMITGDIGTVVVMDSRLWRAVPANEGDVIRIGLHVGYAGEPVRDPKSVVPRAVLEKLPAEARRMFGHWV